MILTDLSQVKQAVAAGWRITAVEYATTGQLGTHGPKPGRPVRWQIKGNDPRPRQAEGR
ncbi:MAG: hypothetical protein M3N98_14900 [Actinomycetota bacterium]|nr:hypothetical protein [Actinomycetota bacterium]